MTFRLCDFPVKTKVFLPRTIDIVYRYVIMLTTKTVDAGVKPIMLSQRVRGAGSRAKHRSDKWAAEGAVKSAS
jgi:hypothetical protein